MHPSVLLLSLLLGASTLAQKIPFTPIVSYITPNRGSYAGGTLITLFGTGV